MELLQTLGIQWTKLIPQLFNFGIVLWVLWKFAYKPVFTMLDARQKKIAEGIANADKIKVELAQTEAKWNIPMGRFGTPLDIGAATVFLCSPGASWITGEILRVGGGAKPR